MTDRPLIISDCDEVLLHMIAPFRDFLAEEHDVAFSMERGDFANALTWRRTGEVLAPKDIWRMLDLFFDTQMDRQMPIAGAVEAVNALAQHADVVILTNLTDNRMEHRAEQLRKTGIHARVFTNQGPKGPALKAILDEYGPARRAFFIDDLPQHHGSVADITPHVTRLHFCGEPMVAPHINCAFQAGHAHARIDEWARALPWLLDRIHGENDD